MFTVAVFLKNTTDLIGIYQKNCTDLSFYQQIESIYFDECLAYEFK